MIKKLGLSLLVLLLIGHSITATASRALMPMPTPSVLSLPANTSTDSAALPCHNSLHQAASAAGFSVDAPDNHSLSADLNTDDNCQHALCKMLCSWQPLSAASLRILNNAAAAEFIVTATFHTHIGFSDKLLRPPKTA